MITIIFFNYQSIMDGIFDLYDYFSMEKLFYEIKHSAFWVYFCVEILFNIFHNCIGVWFYIHSSDFYLNSFCVRNFVFIQSFHASISKDTLFQVYKTIGNTFNKYTLKNVFKKPAMFSMFTIYVDKYKSLYFKK